MKTIDQLTREDMRLMPMHKLRHLDIRTAEQERMVQEVINEKLIASPQVGNPLVFPASVTDAIKTPEDEALLQAKMDAHNAVNRAQLMGQEVELEDEEEEEDEETVAIPLETESLAEVTAPVKVFCKFCDSKGGAHKKVCTRLQAVTV